MNSSDYTSGLGSRLDQAKNDGYLEHGSNEVAPVAQEPKGTIQRLCLCCLDSLNTLIEHSRLNDSDISSLRRCRGTLRLWAHQYGGHDGTLDLRVQGSTEIRQTVLDLLLPMCKISLQGVLTFVLPHTKLEEIESGYKTTCQVYHEIKIQFGTGKESGHCGSTDEGAASQLEPVTVRTAIRKMKTYTECLLDLGHSLDYPASDGSEDELTTYSEPVQINESRGQLPHEPLSSTVLLLTQDEQLRAGSPDYTGRISRDAFEDNPINSLEPYGNVLFTNQGTDIMSELSYNDEMYWISPMKALYRPSHKASHFTNTEVSTHAVPMRPELIQEGSLSEMPWIPPTAPLLAPHVEGNESQFPSIDPPPLQRFLSDDEDNRSLEGSMRSFSIAGTATTGRTSVFSSSDPGEFTTPSTYPDPLPCSSGDCQIQFTGIFRRSNQLRHIRLVHNAVEYPCGARDCSRIFRRKDARLKHRRRLHADEFPDLKPPSRRMPWTSSRGQKSEGERDGKGKGNGKNQEDGQETKVDVS